MPSFSSAPTQQASQRLTAKSTGARLRLLLLLRRTKQSAALLGLLLLLLLAIGLLAKAAAEARPARAEHVLRKLYVCRVWRIGDVDGGGCTIKIGKQPSSSASLSLLDRCRCGLQG